MTSCFLVLFLPVRAPARFLFLCLPLISDFLRPPSDHSFINHHQRHYLFFRIIASMGNMKWARELLFLPSLQGHMAEVPVLIWGEGKRSDKTSWTNWHTVKQDLKDESPAEGGKLVQAAGSEGTKNMRHLGTERGERGWEVRQER